MTSSYRFEENGLMRSDQILPARPLSRCLTRAGLRRHGRPLRLLLTVMLTLTPLAWVGAVEAPLDKLGIPALHDHAHQLERIRSILVAVEGQPVYAQVIRGPALDTPVNIKSLSKTVFAALVGAAIDRGVIESTEQPITDLLDVPDTASPRVSEITVGHLLSMQAGLGRTSGAHYGEWVTSSNWVDYALSRPFVDEPGGQMLYSTGSYHILSAALTRATGRSSLELSREWLGDPLDIRIPPWTRDPQGIYFGGNNMHLSPLALLRLGELYRNGGRHEGKAVLPGKWVEESWEPRGYSRYTNDPYGYGWFRTRLAGYRAYYGRGYGGQMLYVIPELAMTAVITADPTPPASPYFMGKLHQLMEAYVIPAITGSEDDDSPEQGVDSVHTGDPGDGQSSTPAGAGAVSDRGYYWLSISSLRASSSSLTVPSSS